MFWKSRFFKSLLWLPFLFIAWIVLIGSDDRPGFFRAKFLPFVRSIGVEGGSSGISAYDTWTFENTPIGAGGTDSSFTSARIDTLTLGNNADDVDGWMIWIDADGGTGNVLISSDELIFSDFSGGVDIDGDFTAGTVASDAGVSGTTGTFTSTGSFESTLTINPTVVDTEDPSFIIKGDANSNTPALTSEVLTWNLNATADPTDATWDVDDTQGAGMRFMPDEDKSFTFGRNVLYSTSSDFAQFAHIDHANANDYAIRQSNAGKTVVNSASGQLLVLAISSGTELVELSTAGVDFMQTNDMATGDVWEFKQTNANIELTSSNSRQAGISSHLEVLQTSTAAFDALYINPTLSSLGDGSTGDGNNLLNLSVASSPKFRVSTDGEMVFGTSTSKTTAIDTIKTAGGVVRWVRLTVSGSTFWAISDTSLTVN